MKQGKKVNHHLSFFQEQKENLLILSAAVMITLSEYIWNPSLIDMLIEEGAIGTWRVPATTIVSIILRFFVLKFYVYLTRKLFEDEG